MKRLTALVLAGVLVFGTSCGGGNQTNSGEELSDKLDEVDEEYIIDAGSGERLELKDPYPVSAQKPFFLVFSSLRSDFDRMILVRTNTFFMFFGTEAPKAKNCVHGYSRILGFVGQTQPDLAS